MCSAKRERRARATGATGAQGQQGNTDLAEVLNPFCREAHLIPALGNLVDVQGNVLGQAEEQVSDVGAVTVGPCFPGSALDELDSLSVERDVRTVEVNARVHI